jgi:Bacterial protein of unknown function (DUF899)
MIEHRVGTDESPNLGGPAASATNAPSLPAAADRATFQAELDRLRVREKAHTHEATRSPRPDGDYWDMPWYSAHASVGALLVGRRIGSMHLVCYLRDGDRVFETYWTTIRGVEAMDYSYALMDLTVYGRQETWEDSPPGWPQQWQVDPNNSRTNGRPTAQWSRLEAGRSDDLAIRP